MVVQNNPAPWVFLALVVLAGAIILGILFNDTELVNPSRAEQEAYAMGTYSAMGAQATQANWAATQTPEAAIAQAAQTQAALPAQATQTSHAIIVRATEYALQQTATVEAAQALAVQEGLRATQRAILAQQGMEDLARIATATAIAVAHEHDANIALTDKIEAGVDVAVKVLLAALLGLAIVLLSVYLLRSLKNKNQQPVARSPSNRMLELKK